MEKRFIATELRAKKSGDMRTITGYAARYNVLSGDRGGFRERIASDAFKRILATNPMLSACSTILTVRYRAHQRWNTSPERRQPDTTAGRDTYKSVQRGDLNGGSFAFMVDDSRMCDYKEEEIYDEEEGIRGIVKRAARAIIRTIRDFANLIDVSVVTHPAYPQTTVDARHLLVGAGVRSRIASLKKPFVTVECMRQSLSEPSMEEQMELHQMRKRRLAILDL